MIQNIHTSGRIALLVALGALLVLALLCPVVLVEIAVRGGLLLAGIGLAVALRPSGATSAPPG